MGWLARLHGSIVGIDTAPLIYYIEQSPAFYPSVRPFFQATRDGAFTVVTSIVSLVEVLVQPVRRGDLQLADEYRDILLRSTDLSTLPLVSQLAEEAARVRATYNLRTPDAIQIATAIHAGAEFFLTNDSSFRRIPGIDVLVIADLIAADILP